jgi:hypothetical protein
MNPQKAAKFILPSFRRKPESSATIRLPFSDRNYSLRLLVPLRSINHSASGKRELGVKSGSTTIKSLIPI